MSIEAVEVTGPVSAGAQLPEIGQALGRAAAQSMWSLTDDEVASRVAAAMSLRAQADALLLAAVGEADARDLARRRGATSIRAWLRDAHRCDPREAGRLTTTARGLRSGLTGTHEAMTDGAVSLDQARVIVRYVGELAKEVAAPLLARGEADMIGFCAQLDPVLLAVFGRRLAELVDPEGTQDRDKADAVDREAKSATARTATLTAFSDKPGGSCGLSWTPRAMPPWRPGWTQPPRRHRTRTGSATRAVRGSAALMRWSRPASRAWPVGGSVPEVG